MNVYAFFHSPDRPAHGQHSDRGCLLQTLGPAAHCRDGRDSGQAEGILSQVVQSHKETGGDGQESSLLTGESLVKKEEL